MKTTLSILLAVGGCLTVFTGSVHAREPADRNHAENLPNTTDSQTVTAPPATPQGPPATPPDQEAPPEGEKDGAGEGKDQSEGSSEALFEFGTSFFTGIGRVFNFALRLIFL